MRDLSHKIRDRTEGRVKLRTGSTSLDDASSAVQGLAELMRAATCDKVGFMTDAQEWCDQEAIDSVDDFILDDYLCQKLLNYLQLPYVKDKRLKGEIARRRTQVGQDGKLVSANPDACAFWFVKAEKLRGLSTQLERQSFIDCRFQVLLKERPDWLTEMEITRADAYAHQYADEICVVSHRWERMEAPDDQGAQIAEVVSHLQAHTEFTWVWIGNQAFMGLELANDSLSPRAARVAEVASDWCPPPAPLSLGRLVLHAPGGQDASREEGL